MKIFIVREWKNYEQLVAIERRAAVLYQDVGYDSESWSTSFPEDFARHQANGLLWVAVVDGEPVGFAVADLFRDAMHLEELDVEPRFQRLGLGARLVREVIDDAERRLLHRITLRTFTTTPWSQALYRKCGFRLLGPSAQPEYLAFHVSSERRMGLRLSDRCTMALELERPPVE